MSEFSSSVELLVQPSSGSLRDARKEIEASLGDIEVEVTASTTGASSQMGRSQDSRFAGRERAMSRQLLSSSNARLETAVDHLDYGVELDETRNDLLRELIDETESGNFTRARMGGGGVMGAGLLGLGAAAGLLGGAVSFFKNFEFDIPDIPPIRIKKPNWIPIPVGGPTTTPSPSPDSTPTTPPSRLPDPNENPLLDPSPNPQPGSNSPPNPIQEPSADPSPDPTPLPTRRYTPDKINDIVGGGPQPASEPSGDGSPFRVPSADPKDIGAVVGGGLIARELVKAGRNIGPAATGVGFPAVAPEMFPKGSFMRTNPVTGEEVPPSILTPRGRRERLGGFGQWMNGQLGTTVGNSSDGTGTRENEAAKRKRSRTNVTVEQNVTLDPSGMRELRRQMEEQNRRLEKKVKDMEKSLGGGGAMMR